MSPSQTMTPPPTAPFESQDSSISVFYQSLFSSGFPGCAGFQAGSNSASSCIKAEVSAATAVFPASCHKLQSPQGMTCWANWVSSFDALVRGTPAPSTSTPAFAPTPSPTPSSTTYPSSNLDSSTSTRATQTESAQSSSPPSTSSSSTSNSSSSVSSPSGTGPTSPVNTASTFRPTSISIYAGPLSFPSQPIPTSSSPTANGGTETASRLASSSVTHTGAIVGGVIGGLAVIALVVAALILIRRRIRKSRLPPSAEFMHGAFAGSSAFPTIHAEGSTTPSGNRLIPLARQSSLEEDERPPSFTPGSYADPVFEKVQAAVAMRDQYGVHDMEGGVYQ